MTEKDFESVKAIVLKELDGLDIQLTYHCKEHTKDVLKQSVRIAEDEGIGSHEIMLLKFAALFHDTGFLRTYANHEPRGCDIFEERTAHLKFSTDERDIVKGLIMATRLPQQPHTHLQRIICDADLDYLGREDFAEISDKLRREFISYKIVADDEAWDKMQLNFLKIHRYHTLSSQRLREPVKQKHYASLV